MFALSIHLWKWHSSNPARTVLFKEDTVWPKVISTTQPHTLICIGEEKKIRIGIVWSDNGESLGSVVKDEAFQGTPGAHCREASMQTLGSTVHHCRMLVVVRAMKQLCASFSRAITSYSAYLNKKSRLLYNEHGKKPGACRAVGCNCAFQPWTFLWCHSVLWCWLLAHCPLQAIEFVLW